jgi:methionyl-tRNA synthetase
MQNLENENIASAVDAASGQAAASGQVEAPAQALASPSVLPTAAPDKSGPQSGSRSNEALTPTTVVPQDAAKAIATAKVHQVPDDLASARLTTTPAPTPEGGPPTGSAQTGDSPAKPESPGAEPQFITIDDFAKVELRVAQVLVAERIPKADKLLRLEVDLGYEKRQILAGIAQYYEPEKLIGRKIVIVANLAPRKMRGLESNGMLLAASLPPDGAPVLAGFLEDVPLGARLK